MTKPMTPRTPTIAMVLRAMPWHHARLAPWSDANGDDCQAIAGQQHVLYREPSGHWIVQHFTEYNDHSVGIFYQMEPGHVLFDSGVALYEGLAALDAAAEFMRREAAVECADACTRLREALTEEEGPA